MYKILTYKGHEVKVETILGGHATIITVDDECEWVELYEIKTTHRRHFQKEVEEFIDSR